MRFKVFCFLMLVLVGQANIFAQQEPLFQHNYLNPFVYNPAYAGSNNLTEIGAFRNQRWANFDGGIVSNIINVHSRINESNSSIGLQLNTDNIGLSDRTKAHIAYAYRIKISDDFTLQPGLSIGLVDQRINYSGIIADLNDPILAQSFAPNQTGIDANFGLFMKYKEFKLGFSIPQLLDNKLSLTESGTSSYQIERQFIINSSYTFFTSPNQNFFIQPDILLIHSPGLPFHYSTSLLLGLKKAGWIGATYKSNYAIGASIGLSLFNQLKVGFAYDIPLGEMASITNSNNIEIALMYQFGKSDKSVKPSKPETSALENRLKNIVRQQEIKDSIYELTVDSLNTELNIKQLENKVLADENILVKNTSISSVADTITLANNTPQNNTGKNIKVSQITKPKQPIENIQTQSIKIKDDYFTEVLNDKEAPDGYYVVTGMYDSEDKAEDLLTIAKTKFDSPKILVNQRNNKYYVVLYYSSNINGVIETLIESNTIQVPGFSKAWALNYFKNKKP